MHLILLFLGLFFCLNVELWAAQTVSLRLATQNNYLPGVGVLVRVEALGPDGTRDRELWNGTAVLTTDQPGVTLSTNQITLLNGLGSGFLVFSGGGNFNLTATLNGLTATKGMTSASGLPVTTIGGTLPGSSTVWSGVVNITNTVTVPAGHILTIRSNTIVMINGVASGTGGPGMIVQGRVISEGTEDQPVSFTCANPNQYWGEIQHNYGSLASAPVSIYRNTTFTRAGRTAAIGHTSTGPAFRLTNASNVFENCTISDNLGKVMYASGSDLLFTNCQLARSIMGPEITGTGIRCIDTWLTEMHGSPSAPEGTNDNDGIYLWGQQAGQGMLLSGCVVADAQDDGIDTLSCTVTITNCIVRDCNNVNEDAKGISGFDATIDLKRCLLINNMVGISMKTTAGGTGRVNIDRCTINGLQRAIAAAYKDNAPGPRIDFRVTNSIITSVDAVYTDFGPTNFTIGYCTLSESWPGVGNVNASPLFADANANNFRLSVGSPAINGGDPASAPDADGTVADTGFYPFLVNATPVFPFGSTWKFLDNGSDQGAAWRARGFNDSTWSSGPGQLGYSPDEFDEATTVGYGPDAANKYVTTYFRRAFTVLNPSEFTNMEARLLIDDAAVVFLNGQELFRVNMAGGNYNYQTYSSGSGENTLVTNFFSPSLLLEGTNVLAVEVHQQAPNSSDLSFDMELTGAKALAGNQPPSVAITAPAPGASFTTPADIQITALASDSDGTVTSLELYANTQLLAQGGASPLNFTWPSVPVGSYALSAVAADDSGNTRTSSVVNVVVSNPSSVTTNTLVAQGSVWRYLDNGSDQGTAWSQAAFNDAAWGTGTAPLGYCGGGCAYAIATTVGYGPDAGNKYPTTYFRRIFNLEDPGRVQELMLNLLRDDGAVVHINGVEVFRVDMGGGAVNYQSYATGANNYSPLQTTLPSSAVSALVPGNNVLAIEVHQGNGSSSDIVMEARLDAVMSAITNQKPVVNITGPANNSTFPAPTTQTITANALDLDGTITNVAFYVNGGKLADDTTSPYSAAWNNVPAGVYALTAVAIDATGLAATSSVVNVTVSTNTAAPIVAAKLPAPGSLTNLSQITVTFSKPVQGVDAADFLINGSPATNVTGSGSNYTFSFPQPAYGTVNITWAAGHGITDVFTPPVAFNSAGVGATWQYQLLDSVPPTISGVTPFAGSTVAGLTSINVTFSEPVSGVNASDLLINSAPASGMTGSGAGPYTFTFSQPPPGLVQVAWTAGHGIQDASGNPFSPTPWSYTLDTNAVGVIISEIMYHPSSENVLEEYIELHNKGAAPVNLAGWRFSAGVQFTFPNVSIPAAGYLVVAADVVAFSAKYPGVTNVVGNWTGTLGNNGEDIDLDDAFGNRVDSVQYADEGDWATRQRGPLLQNRRGWIWYQPHDGQGASLELINPNVSNNYGQNWAPSSVTNGTPGRINSVYANSTAPLILDVTHFPIVPKSTEPILITARPLDESPGGLSVNLNWRVDAASPPPFTTVAMTDDGLNGDAVANDGLYSYRIPAQANNAVIEFYVSATDVQNLTRTWPKPAIAAPDGGGPTGQVVNALFQIDNTIYAPANNQPLYKLIMTENERAELQGIPSISNNEGPNARMNGTFVSVDASGTEAHYNVGFRNRGHGSRTANPPNYHVEFRSDDRWKGLLALNLNSVNVYVQHLGSVLARKAGADGGRTIAVQLRVNNVNRANSGGTMFGSYAANEAPNSDLVSAHYPDDEEGNLYKVVRDFSPAFDYRGENPVSYQSTYFKESNSSEDDWTDLIDMLRVAGIGNATPFTTENVRNVVHVEQWLRHLAVMNIFGNAESGLNTGYNDDYYLLAGKNDRRFRMLYHDLDSILGVSSLGTSSGLFTATANNGAGLALDRFMHWPDFEPIYYRTLYEILTTTFSQANFDATVDQTLGGYVTAGAIANVKTWMNNRRNFILSQLPPIANLNPPVAVLNGVPRSPNPFNAATITVSGQGMAAYRYSLNGGAYNAETSLATPISLAALPNGTNVLAVIGKGTNGLWQEMTNATVATWVVNPAVPAVRINEVIAQNVAGHNHNGTFPDSIELYNEGNATVDLSGLRFSDDPANPSKFTFPAGTTLAAGGYLTVYANNPDLTPGFHLGFGLDVAGDSVLLYDKVANGGALLDSVTFGKQIADLSIGRFGSGGEWSLTQPTFGSANVPQTMASPTVLRINEWLADSQSQLEFIELYNPAALPVALGGLYLTDNLAGDQARNLLAPLNFMAAGEFFRLTADGNGNGRDRLNFRLSLEQGELGLFNTDLSTIDCVIYGPQKSEVSEGRCPNGSVNVRSLGTPTPGAPNDCPFVPPPPQTVTFLTISNNWSYYRTNLDGFNWTARNFDDSLWPSGPGLLGQYTPTRQQTLPEPIRTVTVTNGQITFYFRAHFNVSVNATYSGLQFRHIVDDGAVFYLNGVEVGRFNMPSGGITAATTSSQTVSDGAYQGPLTITPSLLLPGDNVFAVEVHQSAANSSDVAMGVELQGLIVTNSPAAAGVLINEVLANNATFEEPDGSKPDWIELYNPSVNAVDLSDMSLTDDTLVPRRWVFTNSLILPAQSYVKVRFNPDQPASSTNTGFGLKANGGAIYLFNRTADGGSLLSSVTYGLQAADFSIGRVPNGSTNWVLNNPSLGAANVAASLGDPLQLRINEWMANPASGQDYFEVYNPNAQPVDISRFYLTDDLSNPAKHQLPPLSFIGVGQDAFQKFDADGLTTSGADHVNFSLRAQGEALGITTLGNVVIDSITFGPQATGVSQGRLPDGVNMVVNFTTTPTPGKSNFLPLDNVVINEVLTHTDIPLEDAVELYNRTGDDVDISGWYLSDSQNNLLKYRIPDNTIIPAGGYRVFYENQFNHPDLPEGFSFSSAKGDEVYLSQSTSPGTVTGYRAFATFGAAENGVSFGQFRTSQGDDFTAMSARTFGVDNPSSLENFRTGTGATNVYPKVGPVVFNEIMYHPVDTNDVYEYVELRNVTAAPVPLYDPANPANTWHLRKGIDFNFPMGLTIPAGGYAVVVNFDPDADPVSKTMFQNAYGTNGILVGPYIGRLANSGEALELQKPDAPQTTPGPDFGLVPYIVADRVVYGVTAPWPSEPDGLGAALSKTESTLYGNEPLNWLATGPTVGQANFASATNRPPVLSSIANRSVYVGTTLSFTASATDPDLPGQSLSYSLQGVVPPGASIGSSSGVFQWTPASNQGPASYTLNVRVTDSGSPALSDTKSFTVAVLSLPHIGSVSISSGVLTLQWDSYANRHYRVQTSTDLGSGVWLDVGDEVVADSTTSSFSVIADGNPQRFFRVLALGN